MSWWLWGVLAVFACAIAKGVWEFFLGEDDCEECARIRDAEKAREWMQR
jgi:hypothetical protein